MSILRIKFLSQSSYCDKGVPVTMAWRVLRLQMEEWSPVWRVAVNILNKQLRIADKSWFSSLGVGRGAKRLTVKTYHVMNHFTKPRTWNDPLVRCKQWKKGTRFCTWNVRNLYRSGSFKTVARKLVN
jgi:hypothetical protein